MQTTYGANNYRSYEGLRVWYEQHRELVDSAWKVRLTRHATKKYAFLHMTPSAADSCVSTKRHLYTRYFYNDTVKKESDRQVIDNEQNKMCKTDIVKVTNDDGSRDVVITVNETDVRLETASQGSLWVLDPENKFPLASARSYDENVMPAKTVQGLSYYGNSTNQKISQDLDIRYSVEKKVAYSIFTRYAQKTYSFIGMNQETAEACATAKLNQYTRFYGRVDSSATTMSGKNDQELGIGASVSIVHNGPCWDVTISVNETDVKAASTGSDPATVFATENGRSYDELSGLELDSVTKGEPEPEETVVEATISASCTMPGYTLSDTTFQYRIRGSIVWNTASVTWEGSQGTTALPITTDDIFCRLTCAHYESETILAT